MSESIPNPLSKILIVPAFVPPRESQELLLALRARPDDELGVGADYGGEWQRPMETEIEVPDLLAPMEILKLLKNDTPARRILAPHLSLDAPLAGITSAADFPFIPVGRALTRLVQDPQFFPKHQHLIELLPGSAAARQLAYLESRNIFRDASGKVELRADVDEGDRVALGWFNILLFEELILEGGFVKNNRILKRGLDPREFEGMAHAPTFDGAALPSFPTILSRVGKGELARLFESRDFRDTQLGLKQLFSAEELRRLVIDAYASPIRESSDVALKNALARMSSAAHESVFLALLLSRFFPATFESPVSTGGSSQRLVVRGLRSCRTVDFSDIQSRIEGHVRAFVKECIEPYYGVDLQELQEIQCLKYTAGDYIAQHTDSEHLVEKDGRRGWLKRVARDISILFYLSPSTDYQGGLLSLPRQHILLKAEQGMMVAFPSDHRFVHGVHEVTEGVRFAFATWITCKQGAPVGTMNQIIPF